jgi:hypothetical protein
MTPLLATSWWRHILWQGYTYCLWPKSGYICMFTVLPLSDVARNLTKCNRMLARTKSPSSTHNTKVTETHQPLLHNFLRTIRHRDKSIHSFPWTLCVNLGGLKHEHSFREKVSEIKTNRLHTIWGQTLTVYNLSSTYFGLIGQLARGFKQLQAEVC